MRARWGLCHTLWKETYNQLNQTDRFKDTIDRDALIKEAEIELNIGMGNISVQYRPLSKMSLEMF